LAAPWLRSGGGGLVRTLADRLATGSGSTDALVLLSIHETRDRIINHSASVRVAMITRLAISGYRSLRDIRVTLGALNVVTGANGSGKSSLYRALNLLADIAQGRIIQSLAAEGGLQSTLWAGPEAISRAMKNGTAPVQAPARKTPISLKLGFSGKDYGYAIDLGLPLPDSRTKFSSDPEIKIESQWAGERLDRTNAFAIRIGPSVRILNGQGEWRQAHQHLDSFDSMMTHCADPHHAVELLLLREKMRNWRFYDHLRTDLDAPSRKPQVGTYTPVLASDGSDLAAAVQTIREVGAADEMDAAIADAFPGARVEVISTNGYFELEMRQHGLLRPLKASELSDGTLRYLLLVAALLSPRPPALMILNEPETSLHPALLPPLARLIAQVSKRSQAVVVTHAPSLVAALDANIDYRQIVLEKHFGETVAKDNTPPDWTWPSL
jgi:predicted ATPase